jgi:hypothetical protein
MPDSQTRPGFPGLIVPALLITSQLFLFGPFTIYSGNEAEFAAPFWAITRHLLLPSAVLVSALIALGVILPARLRRGYAALLLGVGVLLWVQANLLVADYGPLDGSAIDWSVHDWRTKYELPLWVGVFVVAVVASRRVAAIATFASGMLLALQSVVLAAAVVQSDSADRAEWQGPSDAMFDVSRTRNAFHIVLDGFHSDVFAELLAAERDLMDRDYAGFVFFEDHAGAFPTTMVSVPAMLTGTTYRQDEPLQPYIRNHFAKGSLFRTLRSNGYRVDSITEMRFDNQGATNFFRMPRPYVSYDAYTRFAAWQLADLSLFRHAPHAARPWIFNDQSWRLQNWFGENPGSRRSPDRRYHSVNGAVVLEAFSREMAVTIDEPLYKFIHVGIPHLPVVVDGNCEFAGVRRFNRETYRAQARCGIRRVAAFLNRLREIGAYDDSLVVIASDHGIGLPPRQFAHDRLLPDGNASAIAGKAMALLLVKPPRSTGPVRVSRAPTQITDIPITVADTLNVPHAFPGASVLKLSETAPRPRTFGMYAWEHEDWRASYFEHLDLLDINGVLRDGASWTLGRSLYPPGGEEAGRSRGLYEAQRSSSGITYRWSRPQTFLHAPDTATGFQMGIRSIASGPQTVTFSVAGRALQTLTLRDQQWVNVSHRFQPTDDPASRWVVMVVDPPWRVRGDPRRLGVMTRDIKWLP